MEFDRFNSFDITFKCTIGRVIPMIALNKHINMFLTTHTGGKNIIIYNIKTGNVLYKLDNISNFSTVNDLYENIKKTYRKTYPLKPITQIGIICDSRKSVIFIEDKLQLLIFDYVGLSSEINIKTIGFNFINDKFEVLGLSQTNISTIGSVTACPVSNDNLIINYTHAPKGREREILF